MQRYEVGAFPATGEKPDRIPGTPVFSIVTSTFNVGSALAVTARSLAAQTCQSFEWLIVDGASTDDTLAVAEACGDVVNALVSEPDTGIYNAWNKLLPRLRGRWVLFLGAGDSLHAPDTLAQVAIALERLPSHITTAYGAVTVLDMATGSIIRVRNESWQGVDGPWAGGRPVLPSHQGVFQRASVFASFRFDERCRISADSEVVMRELMAGRGRKLDIMVAHFQSGGISSQRRNRLRKMSEFVYINWKVGIFWRKPVYQAAILALHTFLHPWRVWRARQTHKQA